MEKKGKKSKKEPLTQYQIRVKSLVDLARTACTFTSSPLLFAVKEGKRYKLMLPGERIDDSSNIYTFETDELANFIVYSPAGESEKLELKNEVEVEQHDFKTYKIQVMELLNNPFANKTADGKEKHLIFKVKDYNTLLKGMLSGAAQEDKMGRIYRFESGGKSYLCAFGTSYDGNVLILYAEADGANVFNFISYNLSSNKLEFLKSLNNTAYVSLAVVNLAEPFPFFKPE